MLPNDLVARLAGPARWLLVAGIAYSLASTALYFMSSPQDATDARGPGAAGQSATPARPAADINALLSSNLFGTVDAEAIETQASTAPTVATRLPLELKGVFVAEVTEESVAIIAQKGRAGELYTVGDKVPGNATLVDVQPDHVVLRRAGVREALYFPAVANSSLAETVDDSPPRSLEAAPSDATDQSRDYSGAAAARETDAGSMEELITTIKQRVEEDPDAALTELGVSPVEEGGASGYRLGDLAQSPYLSQTGLQPGDVILSVNGRPVGDLSQDRLEIDNVLAQGSARLEVQRGNRRFFVTASLR